MYWYRYKYNWYLYQLYWCIILDLDFLLSFKVVMLYRTFMLNDAMLCTMLASYMHVLTLTWGPKYPPLGCKSSISANTNNAGATHNGWWFIRPCIMHHQQLISVLVISAIFSASLEMPQKTLGGNCSLVELCPIIFSILNSPMYCGQSFPCRSFSFKCFIDNSILSLGLISNNCLTVLACCLSASSYFVSC